jgi:putative transposase
MNEMNEKEVLRSYKYRIYPTISQVEHIENWFSMCRHLYNWCLQERKEYFETKKAYISYFHQSLYLTMLRTDRPWYRSVALSVLRDALQRLDKTFKNFYRYVKKNGFKTEKNGKIKGYPKFKKRGQWNSMTYLAYNFYPENGYIKTSKIGFIKAKLHRQLPKNANLRTLTIIKEAGKWFACLSFITTVTTSEAQTPSYMGINLGLVNFVQSSSKFFIKRKKHLAPKEDRVKILHQELVSTDRESPKYIKVLNLLRKAHYKVKCARKDFVHKAANEVLSWSDIIFVEDMDIAKMAQERKYGKNLRKGIYDVSWAMFVDILTYKAVGLGKKVVMVPAEYTTQTCNKCGHIKEKELHEREHRCEECHFVTTRDLNSAMNVLSFGLETLEAKKAS